MREREFGELPPRRGTVRIDRLAARGRAELLEKIDAVPEVQDDETYHESLEIYQRIGGMLAAMRGDLQNRAHKEVVGALLDEDDSCEMAIPDGLSEKLSKSRELERPQVTHDDALRIGSLVQDAYSALLESDPEWVNVVGATTQKRNDIHNGMRDYVDARARLLPDSEHPGSLWAELQSLPADVNTSKALPIAQRVKKELNLDAFDRQFLYHPRELGTLSCPELYIEDRVGQAVQTTNALFGMNVALEELGATKEERMRHIINNADALGAITRISFVKSDPNIVRRVPFTEFMRLAHKIAEDSGPLHDDWRVVFKGNYEPGTCPLQYPATFDEKEDEYIAELTSYCWDKYRATPPLLVRHPHRNEEMIDPAAVYITIGALVGNRPGGVLDPHKEISELMEDVYNP